MEQKNLPIRSDSGASGQDWWHAYILFIFDAFFYLFLQLHVMVEYFLNQSICHFTAYTSQGEPKKRKTAVFILWNSLFLIYLHF